MKKTVIYLVLKDDMTSDERDELNSIFGKADDDRGKSFHPEVKKLHAMLYPDGCSGGNRPDAGNRA